MTAELLAFVDRTYTRWGRDEAIASHGLEAVIEYEQGDKE